MSHEEDRKRSDAMATVPPPEGDDDLYSASTKVGQASAELLALVRAAETADADPSDSKQASDTKLEALKETAARAAKEAAAHEIVRRSGIPPAPPRSVGPQGGDAKSVAPASEVITPKPPSAAAREPEARPAPRPEGGLPPVVGIVAVFIAIALVLAMIVR